MAFLDKHGVERLWLHIVAKLNGKVDKEEGKGLSSNDYTTEEKEQLATLTTLVGDTSVSAQITEAVANKVDKVSGKGLSTNDYTTAEKEKLASLENLVGDTAVSEQIETAMADVVKNDDAITIAEINEVCGAYIYDASEVTV